MKNVKIFFQGLKKLFSFFGLKKFLDSLNRLEKTLFFVFVFLFFSSFSFLLTNFYFNFTKIQPKEGGKLVLGEVGFPTFLNPIYSISSDVDDSIVELLFSGLMKYQGGEIVPDLIENYQILEDGKVFLFNLKNNIFWSDGKEISSDDVIFTLKTIQNPEVKSPLRTIWLGVEVEKISEKSFKFKLKNPSAIFLENCTLKIIPKHIWEKIPPSNFPLSYYNLEPVTSGPFRIKKIYRAKDGKIIALDLVKDERYFGKKPFLNEISFLFFENENELILAAKNKKIDGFPLTKSENIIGFRKINFKMPRYFAVFFNLEKRLFSEKEVREALNLSTDKEEIFKKVILGQGEIVQSPILPEIYGFKRNEKKFLFDLEKANEILKNSGFEDLDGDGIKEKIVVKTPSFQFKSDLKVGSQGKEVEELQKCLAKDPEIYQGEITGYFGPKTKEAVIKFQEKYKKDILEPFGLETGNGIVKEKTREKLNELCFERKEEKITLNFSLTTADQPTLVETAEILKEQWKKIGVEVEIKKIGIGELKREIIPKKDYDALLFGEVLGKVPDPFPFWHSSQKGENGLNLSNYENKDVDKLLEESRESLDETKRKEDLEKFQEILIEDSPAVFLYNPDYLYFVSNKIKGVKEDLIFTPSKKFDDILNWYIKEKRIIKWK
jgi:ABC-type transport system substrate-binding protein